jgi:hypothetical protein
MNYSLCNFTSLSLTVCDMCFLFSTLLLTPVNSVKVREFFNSLALYRFPITGLSRPLGLQEDEVPRRSRQSAHEGGKVFSPMKRPPFPLQTSDIPRTRLCYRLGGPPDQSEAERLRQRKTPTNPSGIEPATFGLVAQCSWIPRGWKVVHLLQIYRKTGRS